MAPVKTWLIDNFTGGESEGSKRGVKGSYRAGTGLDFRTDPDVLTALRKLKKDSDATVDGLVQWMTEAGTDVYMYADNGDLYKRTAVPAYSLINNFASGSGEGMALFDDYIFVADDDGLHRYGPLSGTPAVEEDFLLSGTTEIDQSSGEVTGDIYTLTTAINEGATHIQTFTAGTDNITGVVLQIVAKGTGDWTVTVHNAANAIVASTTVAVANLPTAGRYRFEFSGIHDLTSTSVYHIHAFSSVADGTVMASTNEDFETSEFSTLEFYTDEDVDESSDLTESSTATPTYTAITAIDEGATNRQTFTAERSSLTGISVLMGVNGTGNTRITVHDGNDVEIAAVTRANANIDEGKGLVKWTFTDVATIVPTVEYHFHITSTVADATVYTSTSADLEDAFFRTHYTVLQDAAWHPMIYFPAGGTMAIGNGNFLAVYDNIIYREPGANSGNQRLQFDKSEQVRALALVGDYLAIGVWKGDSIGDHGESRVYFWDGVSSTYNAFKDIPGEINAMVTADDGLLYVVAGGQGDIYVYSGALTLVDTEKSIEENKTIEVYPGAVTSWNSIPRIGVSGGTDTNLSRTIKSYGAKSKNYPRVPSNDYPISTGNTDENVTIGSLLGLGPAKFFVGWQDDTGGASYGVDIIDTANDQTEVNYETLVFDNKEPHARKKGYAVVITFEPLAANQSFDVKYKIDRQAAWQTLGTADTDGTVFSAFSFDKRFTELELQVLIKTSSADAPKLISIATVFETEKDILGKQ